MNTRFERYRVQWLETIVHEHEVWETRSSVTADNRSWTQCWRDTELIDWRQPFVNISFEDISKTPKSPCLFWFMLHGWILCFILCLFILIDHKTVWFCEINSIHVLYWSFNILLLSGSSLVWTCSLSHGRHQRKMWISVDGVRDKDTHLNGFVGDGNVFVNNVGLCFVTSLLLIHIRQMGF